MTVDLTGPCVLIVEDEWLIGDQIACMLRKEGFQVIGPIPQVKTALDIIDNQKVDAAVLDVTLRKGNSFPIARSLADRKVPLIFMTGYSDHDFPAEFLQHPILTKPIMMPEIVSKLRSLLEYISR